MAAYTGGPLNWLNGRMAVSAPNNSVPVIRLIRNHHPRSRNELYDLIRYHHENVCACGVRSKGTIEDFGNNLYDAQKIVWDEYRYSLVECIRWEYDLFVCQSMKGHLLEGKALSLLSDRIPHLDCEETTDYIDEELRIDILVKRNQTRIAGIQVKPLSFRNVRENVIAYNEYANKRWGRPVYYLYYDENDTFVNLEEVVNQLEETCTT